MASERQIEANRRNARKSTGPKSKAGRRRAAQNALKHGLSVFNTDAAAINELAARIAGPTHDREILDLAWIIAAAEIELSRVRRIRASLFEAAGLSAAMEQSANRSCGPQRPAARRNRLGDFHSIQRYEQRAIGRRDRALRRLLLLKTKSRRRPKVKAEHFSWR